MAEDLWIGARVKYGDQTFLLRYLSALPTGVDTKFYPHLVTVAWSYDSANRSGMPDASTRDAQICFEDIVDKALEEAGNAYLVWVKTGGGAKVWFWYSHDVEEMLEIISHALEGRGQFPVEISDEKDPEWSVWREFVDSLDSRR